MSLTSFIGAASSAVHQAVDAAATAAQTAAQPLLDSVRETVAPVVADGLDPIAEHPEWLGPEVSGVARLFADLCRSGPTGSPVLLPRPLQDTLQTALSRGDGADVARRDAARLQELGTTVAAVSAAVVVPAATMGGGAALVVATVGAAAVITAGTAAAAGTAALADAAAAAGAAAVAAAADAAGSIGGALAEGRALAALVIDQLTHPSLPRPHDGPPTLPQPWADLVSFAAHR